MASSEKDSAVPQESNGTEPEKPPTEKSAAEIKATAADNVEKPEPNALDVVRLSNGESNACASDTKSDQSADSSAMPQPVHDDSLAPVLDGPPTVDPPAKVDMAELDVGEEGAEKGEGAESGEGAEIREDTSDQEMVDFKVVYNKQSFNVSFPIDATVLRLKEHIRLLTDVEVANQKIMFKGLMKDEVSLRDHKLASGAKVMVVGSKATDIQSVNQTTTKTTKESEQASAATNEPLCRQKSHKMVLDKYGKPDDLMPGVKGRREALPPTPLAGMYNKVGGKVRLTFKLENDQVWIGTKERTEKIGLTSIKAIVSEPIEGHEEYHLMGIQLGPTEASRYWIYWVPAQYIDSIKDAALGNWQYF